jgi:hypothetical protein
MKITVHSLCQRFHGARLGESGRTLNEQMSTAEQSHEQSVQQAFLPDHAAA